MSSELNDSDGRNICNMGLVGLVLINDDMNKVMPFVAYGVLRGLLYILHPQGHTPSTLPKLSEVGM